MTGRKETDAVDLADAMVTDLATLDRTTLKLATMGLPLDAKPTEKCPRCAQLGDAIGDFGATAYVNADQQAWWCAECGYEATDGTNAAAYISPQPLNPGALYERLTNRADRGQHVDPKAYAIALGSYHHHNCEELLADFLHKLRRPLNPHQERSPLTFGTAIEVAWRLELALTAAGYAIRSEDR